MSIGPSLPPHLQHLARQDKEEEEDSSSSESEDDIGPRLPEVPCRGPAPVGPQLPPPTYQLATAPPGTVPVPTRCRFYMNFYWGE